MTYEYQFTPANANGNGKATMACAMSMSQAEAVALRLAETEGMSYHVSRRVNGYDKWVPFLTIHPVIKTKEGDE